MKKLRAPKQHPQQSYLVLSGFDEQRFFNRPQDKYRRWAKFKSMSRQGQRNELEFLIDQGMFLGDIAQYFMTPSHIIAREIKFHGLYVPTRRLLNDKTLYDEKEGDA